MESEYQYSPSTCWIILYKVSVKDKVYEYIPSLLLLGSRSINVEKEVKLKALFLAKGNQPMSALINNDLL